MTILIVEDNIIQLNAIAEILLTANNNLTLLKAATYDDAIFLIDSENIQLFILDIQLDKFYSKNSGIEIGKYIRSKTDYMFAPILYITSISNQISTAINDIHCYNYLMKPYSAEELIKSVQALINSPFIEKEPLKIRDLQGIYTRINPEDIIHIFSSKKVLTICSKMTCVETRDFSLEEILQILPSFFLRIHKSHIINKHYIESYDKTTRSIHLSTEKHNYVPVGRVYKETIEREII